MTADREGSVTTYSEMHRENATAALALREKIEALGDTDLMRLLEDQDRLSLESEMAREIRGEWADDARKIIAVLGLPPRYEGSVCTCDICAITHGLAVAVARLTEPTTKEGT